MKRLLTGASVIALTAAAGVAAAQEVGSSVSEVIVTGTRQTGVRAADSAAPIQVVGADALRRVGPPDLANALAESVPSLNVQQFGSDAAALTVTAALRGLSPNDTLVLVDGKRRHTTANLSVDGGSPYSGSATVDLSYIPVSAIDHVEVLQDGAAAQYGSDAIGGVVNIILKKADHGGLFTGTSGQYYEGDGDTGAASLNAGFALADKGFVNVTLEERTHSFSQQGGPDRRFFDQTGAVLPGQSAVVANGLPGALGYPRVNHIYGDPESNTYNAFFNAGYDLGSGVQAYAFGSYGQRQASAFENYRQASRLTGATSTGLAVFPLPNGFDPREAFRETDYSITGGVKGEVAGWNFDVSSTYGRNRDAISTINSANLGLFPILQAQSSTPIVPQRNFDDGAFSSTEWTNTIDVDRAFAVGLASPLNVAVGFEHRRDVFALSAGEPSSYFAPGAASFTGYDQTSAGSHARVNYAVYADLAADLIKGLHLDLAGRYENYSDFGDTEVGKATARYDFNPAIALRGTVSTGFRAPTLAEEYYSGTNVGPTTAFGQLPANSPAAQLAGFAPLKPEISHNYSVGFVAHPISRLQITGDVYEIDIKDRIVTSGSIVGYDASQTPSTISSGVLAALQAHGNVIGSDISYAGIQIFANAANTRTRGAEVTANYSSDFDQYGHVDWTLGANYNDNKVTHLTPLPAIVTNAAYGQTSILSASSLDALTTATPKEKVILGAFYTLGKFTVNFRDTIYGETSQRVSFNGTGTGTGEAVARTPVTSITDLEFGYALTKSLRLNAGAFNLFNRYPPTVPQLSNGAGGVRPADGNNVYNEPVLNSPWGINGGYYYGRVTYTF